MTGYDCLLRCRYCLVKKNKDKFMAWPIYLRVLELLKKIKFNNIIVTFHGGEPLLYYKNIYKFINLAKQINKKIDFSLVTNGLLLNEKTLEFFKKVNLNLSLSLDGDYQSQLKNRTTENIEQQKYQKSLDTAINLLLNNYDKNCLQVYMVVASNTVEQLIDNVNYLIKLGFDKISFDFAFGQIWSEKSIEVFKEKIIDLAKMNLPIFNYSKIDLLRYAILSQQDKKLIKQLRDDLNSENKFLCIDYNGDIFSEEIFIEKLKNENYLTNILHLDNFDSLKTKWFKLEQLLDEKYFAKEIIKSETELAKIMFDFVKNNYV